MEFIKFVRVSGIGEDALYDLYFDRQIVEVINYIHDNYEGADLNE